MLFVKRNILSGIFVPLTNYCSLPVLGQISGFHRENLKSPGFKNFRLTGLIITIPTALASRKCDLQKFICHVQNFMQLAEIHIKGNIGSYENSSLILFQVKLFKYQCKEDKNFTILHVKAKKFDSDDTVHYLWTTIDYPSVVVAHTTDSSVQPVIEWNSCWNYSISFQPNVQTISAFVVTGIFEYDDPDDKQDATANLIQDILPDFSWQLESCGNGTNGNPDAVFTASSTTLNSKANIRMEVRNCHISKQESFRLPIE